MAVDRKINELLDKLRINVLPVPAKLQKAVSGEWLQRLDSKALVRGVPNLVNRDEGALLPAFLHKLVFEVLLKLVSLDGKAAVLIHALSAPALSTSRISSRQRSPPPTAKGMKTSPAVRRIMS